MPNALLFMSDEHNPLYSSVYGHGAVQTPNMERLAERGTLFRTAHCPSPLCMRYRSAFMSGRRMHEILNRDRRPPGDGNHRNPLAIRPGAADHERVVFSAYHGHGTRGSAYMIRRGRWKYLHCARAPHQLFDLHADPDELDDMATERPEIAAGLAAELARICDPEVEHQRAEDFIERQLADMAADA